MWLTRTRVLAARISLSLVALGAACSAGSTAPPRSSETEDADLSALKTDRAYRADIELICNVDARVGGESLDPLELEQKRDDFLVEHVKHPDAIYFLTLFRAKPARERAEMLSERARAIELKACPLPARLLATG
jgi:hypothetical protein